MSADFSDADLARAERLGCAIFKKPLDIVALTAWLEQVERSISPERTLFNWE
jgi:hypothetical protein